MAGARGTWRHLEDLPDEVLLTRADVEAAAEVLAGAGIVVLQLQQPVDALRAALGPAGGRVVLDDGPDLVVLGAGADGDVAARPGGELVVPHADVPVVDTTGAGDAFSAALVAALARDPEDPAAAVRDGADAAGRTVVHLGGRPSLSPRR